MEPLDERPKATRVAELLAERHHLESKVTITVEVSVDSNTSGPRLLARLDRKEPAERIEVEVLYLRGGPAGACWDRSVDALDALVGTLAENGFAHRELPAGGDIRFDDSVFFVRVECLRLDLERRAEALLRGSNES